MLMICKLTRTAKRGARESNSLFFCYNCKLQFYATMYPHILAHYAFSLSDCNINSFLSNAIRDTRCLRPRPPLLRQPEVSLSVGVLAAVYYSLVHRRSGFE